ncbi:MAG: NAD(P)/FAD-dependent oxidoreductase [bacterium]|nr:NAD(P)/FAD-dependent oxidoreductase [bacterium]MDE0352148.1 NAD(P)/FAD-dependent oxidoreductase [bacterium]
MSEQQHSPITRRCDVAVVGGSAAGLAAALQIQRQSRSVIVIDSGEPRNAPAAHLHGYLGYDGEAPTELIAAGRAELRRYGGEILTGRVDAVDRDADGFGLDAGGVTVRARRVVAATGVADELPAIEGIARHWGKTVIHCPFCHGYEVRGQGLVQVVTHPAGLHPARLFAHLSDRFTLVISADFEVDTDEVAAFEVGGTHVLRGNVRRIINGPNETIAAVELTDGRRIAADAVVVTTYLRPRIEPFSGLGLTAEPHPIGVADVVATDPTGETSVDGLYAAGNLTDPSQQVLAAAADGSYVGAMVALDLATRDRATACRRSPAEAEWNARYSGDEVWSGAPNGTLVAEIARMTPGRVLDLGAGEGGDSLWLAERGWDVTATDVAQAGLDRLASKATTRGADIRCVTADANARHAFGDDTYDLVSLFYSAIPRTGDDRAIANIMNAVAPGGTLLMVGHAAPRPGAPTRDDGHIAAWDRASYVGVDHVETAIRSTPGWTVVTSEVRERPPGSSTHHHHDQDVVFRAQRDDA